MTRERSPNYVFTARHSTEEGARQIEAVRAAVRAVNSSLRTEGEPERFRVVVSGRKGSDPYAWKYDNKHMRGKRRRLEDMEKVDVYVIPRK